MEVETLTEEADEAGTVAVEVLTLEAGVETAGTELVATEEWTVEVTWEVEPQLAAA